MMKSEGDTTTSSSEALTYLPHIIMHLELEDKSTLGQYLSRESNVKRKTDSELGFVMAKAIEGGRMLHQSMPPAIVVMVGSSWKCHQFCADIKFPYIDLSWHS